ncbi:MAG: right-handed parallel beta-helix repeat-containing protein, partial [Sphingomonadales bacterium]
MSMLVVATAATMLFDIAPASAQATRTWVSGVGDDANPCSRTAPCKTFAGAISKTAAGGEINCLDPGGWGAVTITKAITIDCTQFPGSILNAATNGVIINAGVNDNITLRGLEIAAGTGGSTGVNGVRFIAGLSLTMEKMIIRNNGSVNSAGILFQPSGLGRLIVDDVTIINNNGAGANGILVQPTGTGGLARVTLDRVRIHNNLGAGIKFDHSVSTNAGGTVATISNSHITANATGVQVVTNGILVNVLVSDTTISSSSVVAFSATGANGVIFASDNAVTGNSAAVATAALLPVTA